LSGAEISSCSAADNTLNGSFRVDADEYHLFLPPDSFRAATIYLHHFAEIVVRARPSWLPHGIGSARDLWRWVSGYCTMLRTDRHVADVGLCGDVADALKHAILTRNVDVRQIRENDAVLALGTGYGELSLGEGKYRGIQQVIVLANSGTRARSSVLQNVIDAWRRAAGLDLPAVGAAYRRVVIL
jgi:hypothetical protein